MSMQGSSRQGTERKLGDDQKFSSKLRSSSLYNAKAMTLDIPTAVKLNKPKLMRRGSEAAHSAKGSELSLRGSKEVASSMIRRNTLHHDYINSQMANSGISNLYNIKKQVRINAIKNTPFTWNYESLDFDSLRTKIFEQKKKSRASMMMEWVAYALIGVFTGLTCAIMMSIEEFLIHEKRHITDIIVNGSTHNLIYGWFFFSGFSMLMAMMAACLTVFYGPGAVGSGITELIAYLNGINYPNLLAFETLFTKIFGVLGAVVGSLCVGKEGPMAHIGANIGAGVAYLPLPRFDFLRNDWIKRELIAAGVSAGVSTAFGAPVGGALFAYEMSKPNTFWRFGVLWKSFFSCSLAVLI